MITRKFRASPVKVTGLSATSVPFESSLEQDYLFLLRFRRGEIERFERANFQVPWFDEHGERREYTPDIKIFFAPVAGKKDGAIHIAEIKHDNDDDPFDPKSRLPFTETDDDRNRKWAAANNFARVRGWTFEVAWEHEIRTPLLRNVKFLVRALDSPAPDRGSARLVAALKRRGPTELGVLMAALEPDENKRAQLYQTLYVCIASKRIVADLDQLLGVKTVLRVGQG